MKPQIIYIILLLIAKPVFIFAQQYEPSDSAGVMIYADSRLEILTNKLKTAAIARSRAGMIRSGRGYRIQIYNGNDKNKAISLKVDFIRRYPKIPTYMTYIQPQFRVKIGDFQTRADAQKMYQELSRLYSPVMIVPDIIVINTFKND